MESSNTLHGKVALVTGGAARLGAATVRHLHTAGADVVIHYRSSSNAAESLRDELNGVRPDSAAVVQGDLNNPQSWTHLIDAVLTFAGRLDILINNASSFYPTPIDNATLEQWDDLFGSNARAPFFLAQAAAAGTS